MPVIVHVASVIRVLFENVHVIHKQVQFLAASALITFAPSPSKKKFSGPCSSKSRVALFSDRKLTPRAPQGRHLMRSYASTVAQSIAPKSTSSYSLEKMPDSLIKYPARRWFL